MSRMESPASRQFSSEVVLPTACTTMVTVPAAGSAALMVRGMRSPLSYSRRMTNCPGLCLRATRGEQGLVTRKLNDLIAAGRKIDFVLAVGPVPMMRAVAQLTAPLGIKTMVSLNSIMVDGTGMCGGCRVLLDGKSKFACVDGPEFDASMVDFGVLMQRNAMYRDKECESLKQFNEHKDEQLERLREELAAGEKHYV